MPELGRKPVNLVSWSEEMADRNSLPKTQTKRGLVALLILLLVLGMAVFLCWWQIDYCDKNCTYVYNEELEGYVNELQTNVTKERKGNLADEKYTIKGYLETITSSLDSYDFVFNNFFERTLVNGTIASYRFSIPKSQCDQSCATTLEELIDYRETFDYNELTTTSFGYSVKNLSLYDKLKLVGLKLAASFGDDRIDVSTLSTVSIDFSIIPSADLEKACSESVWAEGVLTLAEDTYRGILSVLMNEGMWPIEKKPIEDVTDLLLTYGWFDCNSCTGTCTYDTQSGIGLDYTFFPMYVSLLREKGSEIDPDLALDVLSRSYGVNAFTDFESFAESKEGWLDRIHGGNKWGSEPICGPYWVSRQLGETEGPFFEVARKLCEDRAFNLWMGNLTEAQYATFSDYTDEATFSALALLFDDLASFRESELVADESSISAFIIRAMDDYVYGYEFDDEAFVRYGNQGMVWGIWSFVERFSSDGGANSFQNKNTFRDIILALRTKKQLADNSIVTTEIDKLIADLLTFVQNPEYIDTAFYLGDSDFSPGLEAREKAKESLGDGLRLWATDQEFYTKYVRTSWKESTQMWLFSHFNSDECGKSDSGYFSGIDSDGKCLREYVGIRSNLSTMIYLMLLSEHEK